MVPLRLHSPLGRFLDRFLCGESDHPEVANGTFRTEHMHPGGNVFGHFFMHNPVSRHVRFFIFTTPPLRHPFRNTYLKNGQDSFLFDRWSVFFIAWRTCQSNAALLHIYKKPKDKNELSSPYLRRMIYHYQVHYWYLSLFYDHSANFWSSYFSCQLLPSYITFRFFLFTLQKSSTNLCNMRELVPQYICWDIVIHSFNILLLVSSYPV